MKTSLILAKVDYIHGLIDPDWVDGGPGQPGPLINEAIVDYMVAGVLREIAKSVSHKQINSKLRASARAWWSARQPASLPAGNLAMIFARPGHRSRFPGLALTRRLGGTRWPARWMTWCWRKACAALRD